MSEGFQDEVLVPRRISPVSSQWLCVFVGVWVHQYVSEHFYSRNLLFLSSAPVTFSSSH